MIQKVLNELKFHLSPTKPTKQQALDAIKLLVAEQMIPIARAQMKVKIIVASKVKKQLFDEKIKELIDSVEEEIPGTKTFECIAIIDPVNYREIVEIVEKKKNDAMIEVLDMAAIKE